MDEFEQPPRNSLAGMLGRSAVSDDEIRHLRRKAWTQQGLLIVGPWDSRLSRWEAAMIRRIAERLYGEGQS